MSTILIVGAGPTGLTLACELAVRNVPFRLIDSADGPFAGSRAKGVQPRTLEVFDRLGIVNEIVAAGLVGLPYRQHDGQGGFRDVARGEFAPRPDVPWPAPVLIPQWRTEAALRGRLEALGGHVEYATTLVEARLSDDGVRVKLERGATTDELDVAWVVGCDGGRSTVRHIAGFNFIGQTHDDLRMLVGDFRVEGEGIDRTHWHVWRPETGGFVAMAPLAGTDAFQVQIAVGPQFTDTATLEAFQHLVERLTRRTDIRLSAPNWMSLWRANIRMVDAYRRARLFVAGDAAHVHTPAGGQGMNTGIQDAFNLGWKLAAVHRGASSALLDSYEDERLPVAKHVLELSTRLAASTTSSHTKGLVPQTEDTSQLSIHYRESALSHEHRSMPGALRAGDRAPDAPGLIECGSDGTSMRLFDVLRGPRATLVTFGDGWAPIIDAALAATSGEIDAVHIVRADRAEGGAMRAGGRHLRTLIDAQGHAETIWAPGAGALFAIRPDGVIGFVDERRDGEPLNRWLRKAGFLR